MREYRTGPESAAAYTLVEAARYVRLPVATLRSWVVGRPYPRAGGVAHFPALIHPPQSKPPILSFPNLVEAHVLRSLRTNHGVPLKAMRQAIGYAERELGIERLLLSDQLRTDAGRVFLERYGRLIELSASGQLAMRKLFEAHLMRVEWGAVHLPARLYPFVSESQVGPAKPIVIDPQLAFGRPVVARQGVTTFAIAERLDAGETVEAIALDYGLDTKEIEAAVLYERAA